MDKESEEKRKKEFEEFFRKAFPYITSQYEALRLQGERPEKLDIEWSFTKTDGKYPDLVIDTGCADMPLNGNLFE